MSNVTVDIQPNSAAAVVNEGFSTATAYSETALNSALTFLNTLSTAANQLTALPTISTVVPSLGNQPAAFVKPTAPSDSTDLSFRDQTAPSDISVSLPAAMTVSAAPAFSAVPQPVNTITAPQPLSALVPVAPGLTDVDVPAPPDVVLPDVPVMLGVSVPAAPMLNLQRFDGVPATGPVPPSPVFSFVEPTYASSLLANLRTVLEQWVLGDSEDLPPVVEQQIWERARVRENANAGRKIKEALRAFASRGFAKPPGALSVEVQDAVQEAQNAGSSLSRDVAIKQAELEIENRRMALKQAFEVESSLINYQNLIAQRSFEGSRVAFEAAIQVYQIMVSKYQADIQQYLASVEAHKADIQMELAKLEQYRSEIDAQRLIGEINLRAVQIYQARVESVRAVIDIFKAQVEAANTQALVNKTRIDGFAAAVGAYGEQVRAKTAEYEGYATQVRAELAKVEVYKSQSDAYRSQVEGYAAAVGAQAQAKTLEYRGVDAAVDLFKARTEVFRSKVEAEGTRVRAAATAQEVRVQSFDSQVRGEAARLAADTSQYATAGQLAIQSSNLALEGLKAQVAAMIQKIQALIEAVKGGAGVSAQIAAAALSSIHVSGSVADSVSSSLSAGVSESYNHNFDEAT